MWRTISSTVPRPQNWRSLDLTDFWQRPWLRLVICLLFSASLSALLLGPQLHARFSATDDHELLHVLGPKHELPFREVGPAILNTEVGKPGESTRYRPVYYALRVAEVSLWGDKPERYYAARLALFAGLVLLLSWVATSALGLVTGLLLTLVTFDFPMWGDIWARLGPAEQYASMGTAVFLAGLAPIVKAWWSRARWPWSSSIVVMAGGFAVAAGSKENFVFLGLPLLIVTIYGVQQRLVSAKAMIIAALSLAFAAFVEVAAFLGVRALGADIYGNGVSVASRIGALGRFAATILSLDRPLSMRHAAALLIGAVFIALMVASGWTLRRKLEPHARSRFDRR
ncbi:MAG TPA: hypothetical protein VF113_13035, partial [Stellaceae bacterium]